MVKVLWCSKAISSKQIVQHPYQNTFGKHAVLQIKRHQRCTLPMPPAAAGRYIFVRCLVRGVIAIENAVSQIAGKLQFAELMGALQSSSLRVFAPLGANLGEGQTGVLPLSAMRSPISSRVKTGNICKLLTQMQSWRKAQSSVSWIIRMDMVFA